MKLSPAEFGVLWDGMIQARAWGRLNSPNESGMLDMEGMFDLCMEAGYSKEAAEKAANVRGNARMDQNLKP